MISGLPVWKAHQMVDFLTNSVSYIVPFAILISIVAFFHELGHFLVGRWCGVKADVFSIGFGPELYARADRYGEVWQVLRDMEEDERG